MTKEFNPAKGRPLENILEKFHMCNISKEEIVI
jgi:hypothetical protein